MPRGGYPADYDYGRPPRYGRAIAKELGIIEDASGAITGAELSEMDDETFERQVDQYSVYARVQPEHKVRIVSAWKNAAWSQQ